MNSFDIRRRRWRRALWLLALACPLVALAQPVPCSKLPRAEQEPARKAGLCVDDAQAAAQPPKSPGAALPPKLPKVPTRKGCATLPDFAGKQMSYNEAVPFLPKGFRARVTDRRPSSAPADTIVEQSTEVIEGTLCWANFVVSDGSLVRVPPLRDMTREQATQRLQSLRLQAELREMPTDAAAVGHVFNQRPEAGVEVPRGSAVQVAIARAPTLEVPDVVGRSVDDAKPRLARFSMRAVPEASLRPAGEVLAQRPEGGTQARPGTEVTLTVSDGSLVVVPELVKQPLAKARALLDEAQLRAGTVEEALDGPLDSVAAQDPPAGSTAKRHSVVTLHVPAGLTVPDVVGHPVSEAQAALSAFTVSTDSVESDRREGEVLSQSPTAGARVASHTPLTLRVSDGSIVTVPELHGLTLADARAALLRAGDLHSAVSGRDERDAAIVDTSVPVAGERVKRGGLVMLTLVPAAPWWPWVAGAAALLAAAGTVLTRWLRRRVPRRSVASADVQFSSGLEFGTRPVEARAGGPEAPSIGLRAELLRGRVEVQQHEEEVT
jgi:beta-lactam-binding protein with PASTA domain